MTTPEIIDIERRRALARKLIASDAANTRMAHLLQELLSPTHLRAAAQEGFVIVGERQTENKIRLIAKQLVEKGYTTYLDILTERTVLSPNLTQAGVVVLIMSPASIYDIEIQHRYGIAMTLGKVVIPMMIGDEPPPALYFDMPVLKWHNDAQSNLMQVLQLFNTVDASSACSS